MKLSAAKKYENLVVSVKNFVRDLRTRKSTTAFFYNASEQPQAVVPNAPPQQFNVLEVRQLITHVLTAQKLGYQTTLTANGDKLLINFEERLPSIPIELAIL